MATQARKMEEEGEHLERQAPQIRASIAEHKKIVTQIRKAIKAIELAEGVAREEDPDLLKNWMSLQHKNCWLRQKRICRGLRTKCFQVLFIRSLRKKGKRPTRFSLPSYSSKAFPGFGVVKIDYWRIEELDKCLDSARTTKGEVGRVGRDRIIKKVSRSPFRKHILWSR